MLSGTVPEKRGHLSRGLNYEEKAEGIAGQVEGTAKVKIP